MKLRTRSDMSNFGDKAIDLFVKTAIGKPFKDSEGEVIGHISEARRIEDSKVVEVIVEAVEYEVPHNVVSFSMGGKKNENH